MPLIELKKSIDSSSQKIKSSKNNCQHRKKLLSKNKTPRNAIKIQNGKIITVDIGLADFCEIYHQNKLLRLSSLIDESAYDLLG